MTSTSQTNALRRGIVPSRAAKNNNPYVCSRLHPVPFPLLTAAIKRYSVFALLYLLHTRHPGFFKFFFFNPHPRICLFILEREERKEGTERGRGGEERETDVRHAPRLWDQTCNLGMCPDRGSDPQPFGVRDSTLTG